MELFPLAAVGCAPMAKVLRLQNLPCFVGILILIIAVAACSNGGGASPHLPPSIGTPTTVSQTVTTTLSLKEPYAAQSAPSVAGISTSVTLPLSNAPNDATLTLTISTTAPSGMPKVPVISPQPFVYYTLAASADVTLGGAPAFSVTLPSVPPTHGQLYAWTFTETGGWRDLGAVAISGSTVKFGGASAPISLEQGVPLVIVPFTAARGASCPTPSPSPTPRPGAPYTFIRLPSPFFVPREINDNGVVAGDMNIQGAPHAAVYENGQIRLLPALPGFPISIARGINNRNEVVGGTWPEDYTLEKPVLYSGGHVYDLHANGAEAEAINNVGTIAGFVYPGSTSSGTQQVVLFDAKTCTPILFPFSAYGFSLVHQINDRGQYIGEFDENGHRQTYVASGTTIQPLGIVGTANDIDNEGDIVGEIGEPGTGPPLPYIRNGATGTIIMPFLPGYQFGQARAINDAGQVVGISILVTGNVQTVTGFLYHHGKIRSIEQLIGIPNLMPVDVNNHGAILVRDDPRPAGILVPISK